VLPQEEEAAEDKAVRELEEGVEESKGGFEESKLSEKRGLLKQPVEDGPVDLAHGDETKDDSDNQPPPRQERELDFSQPVDVLEFIVRVTLRVLKKGLSVVMASFGDIIEQMKDMPIKGEIPSSDDVAKVAAAAQHLSKTPNNPPPNRHRLLPTQAEIDMIKAALLDDAPTR
jgi:hypothetical protein